jgi:hypothetical protein
MKPRPHPLRPLSPRWSLAARHLLIPLHQPSPPSSQTRPPTSCLKVSRRFFRDGLGWVMNTGQR